MGEEEGGGFRACVAYEGRDGFDGFWDGRSGRNGIQERVEDVGVPAEEVADAAVGGRGEGGGRDRMVGRRTRGGKEGRKDTLYRILPAPLAFRGSRGQVTTG